MSYSKATEAKIDAYREQNSRCRTCKFADQHSFDYWNCKAKRKRYKGRVSDTYIQGVFCKLYEAKKIGDGRYE